MSLNETMLAETLRSYLVEHAPLQVSVDAFNLDLLLPDKPSMSLRMTGGEPERAYIDGSRAMRQTFTIFYRNADANSNEEKSAMLGALNTLGAWMDSVMKSGEKPYLGDWLKVTQLEQVTRARLDTDEQDENYSSTYLAEYVLVYRTV